jgi:hypothetical protein
MPVKHADTKRDYPLALWMSIAGGRSRWQQDRAGLRFGTPQIAPIFMLKSYFRGDRYALSKIQKLLLIRFSAEVAMDNFSFGMTLLVVGMGGTLVALGILALIMGLLKKIFPLKEESSN